jgi:diadenosine tetraphosphate (Ap4A) HIT family hydrolase
MPLSRVKMMNETMKKFGYPSTLVCDLQHWCVLMRPAQATLGALVLICKDKATSFAEIPPEAFSKLSVATRQIETALQQFRVYERINYLMLMMVDPDVHFHVLPRYSEIQEFSGIKFPDPGWPGMPDLSAAVTPDNEVQPILVDTLKECWPN